MSASPPTMHDPGALSYVVLDIPEPQASAVTAIRKAHRDLFRAALPVEVTLTDSFDSSQDPAEAFAALDSIASGAAPIQTSFAGAHRFPGSDTFVMLLATEEPFRVLRQQILDAGLKFEAPSAYAFTPHCTLRTLSPVTSEDAAALLRTEVPGRMVLDTLSVYTLTRAENPAGVACELRHRARLARSR
jgi:2'-5' RNA ligase